MVVEEIENNIEQVEPRNTVEVHLPDGRVLRGPRNSEIGIFFGAIPEFKTPPVVGAVVNGIVKSDSKVY